VNLTSLTCFSIEANPSVCGPTLAGMSCVSANGTNLGGLL
jgi:hypothetical protein